MILLNYEMNIENRNSEMGSLVDRFETGEYAVDKLYQREDCAWDEPKKKSFIKDMLLHPVPVPIYLDSRKENSVTYVLDGQQRLTTFKQFKNNEFALPLDIETIGKYGNLGGLTFDELHKDIQKLLLQSPVPVDINKSGTDREMANIYIKLNMGSPLYSTELRKAMNPNYAKVVNKILETNPLFTKEEEPYFIKTSKKRDGWRPIIETTYLSFLHNQASGYTKERLEAMVDNVPDITMADRHIKNMMVSFSFVAKALEPFLDSRNLFAKNTFSNDGFTTGKGLLGKNMVKLATFLHHDLTINDGINLEGKEILFGGEILRALHESRTVKRFAEFYSWNRDNSEKSTRLAHEFVKGRIYKKLNEITSVEKIVEEYLEKVA